MADPALIGPNWRFGPDGTDWFQDPEDWVLREVAYGLEHKKGVFIPVLFDTTTEDAYCDLPMSLAGIPSTQPHPSAPARIPGRNSDSSSRQSSTELDDALMG